MRRGLVALVVAFGLMAPAAGAQEAEALRLINQARAAKGCPELVVNPKLQAAAEGHAKAMSKQNFFGHKSKNGASVGRRVTAQGYNWRKVAENIAMGWPTPERTVQDWLSSAGHRKNILDCSLRETGLAVVYDPNDAPLPGYGHAMKYYWVQTFGRR